MPRIAFLPRSHTLMTVCIVTACSVAIGCAGNHTQKGVAAESERGVRDTRSKENRSETHSSKDDSESPESASERTVGPARERGAGRKPTRKAAIRPLSADIPPASQLARTDSPPYDPEPLVEIDWSDRPEVPPRPQTSPDPSDADEAPPEVNPPAPTASPPASPSISGPTSEQQHNLDAINQFRDANGAPPVRFDIELAAFAAAGSQQFSADHTAHAHFRAEGQGLTGPPPCPSWGENQGRWPLGGIGTDTEAINRVTDMMLQKMMDEGTGNGFNHHDTIINKAFTRVGIGLLTDDAGTLWYTSDFGCG